MAKFENADARSPTLRLGKGHSPHQPCEVVVYGVPIPGPRVRDARKGERP